MKKNVMVVMGLVLMSAVTFGKQYKIGATQIVEHSVLDSIRVGFVKALDDNKIDYKLDYQNAQGEMTNQQLIAKRFVNEKEDLVLTASTASAMAMAGATKTIPVLFGAVSDPKSAGVLTNGNVTGISDAISSEKLVLNVKKLFPNAKKIGIIYNTSEKNSELNIEKMKPFAKTSGLEVVATGVTSISEVPSATDVMLKNVDVVFMLPDNLTVSAAPVIYAKAKAEKKPVFSMGYNEEQMAGEVLLGITVDYSKMGYDLGLMAIKILNGTTKVQDMPFTVPSEYPIIVNEKLAATYNVKLTDVIK